jgi:hypothetical protein
MAYGEIKVDTVTFTDGGIDKSVSISGLVQNPTFSGNITVTGTISGNTVQGQTVSGVTVTGTTANFVSGVFTTQISGATITGNVGSFTTITGGTVTLTSGVFASGTAAAPSVSIGTTDNGLYSPGADQVAVATNGTGRLFVDASGNVGVGTSSVNALLEVNSSTVGGEVQRIEGNYSGSGSVTLTNWRRAGGSVAAAFKYNDDTNPLCMSIGTTTSHEFRIRTADTDAITIDTSQRVGIGTSAPGSNLDLAGTTSRIRWDLNNAYTLATHGNAAFSAFASSVQSAADYQFQIAGITKMSLDASGRVGIGTTSPLTKFVASNGGAEGIELAPAYSAGNNFTFHINRSGSAYVTNSQVASAHIFRISSDATEAARIDSSGRLLVGTPTVISSNWGGTAALLQVAKNDFLPIGFYTYSDSAGENGYCPYVELHRARGTQASPTVVGSGDDLGLINFYGHDGSTFIRSALIKAVVDGTPGANDMPGRLVFSTTADGASSPTERLRITSAGLVGIGTSSPSSKLDVTVPVNNPSTGSPDAGSFITARGNTTTVGYGPSFQLANNSGAKETFWRISAVTASGNNGDLVFNGYNGGADYPERLRITAGGLVGIGTTGPGEKLHVSGGKIKLTGAAGGGAGGGILSGEVAGELHIQSEDYTGASFADIVFDAGNGSGSYTERARIDSNGRLLVGTSSVVNDYWLGGAQTIESAKDSLNGITVYAATGFSPGHGSLLGLHRARGTMASPAIVANGDTLGAVYFSSYDGSTYLNSAAIDCVVDGTPGANDTPGRLVFSTTADGASSPTERLRITSAGLVGIGTSTPGQLLHLNQSGSSCEMRITSSFADFLIQAGDSGDNGLHFYDMTNSAYRMMISNAGNVGIGTTSPAYAFVVSAAGASGIEFGPAYSGTANLVQHYSRSGFVYVDAVNDAAQHRFQISGTERARIDSSGRLLVGTSTTRTYITGGACSIFNCN